MPGKVLTVFVQPEDWTGDEEERPIKKLNVTLEHFLDSTPTRGAIGMRSPDTNCKRCLFALSRNMNFMLCTGTISYNVGISSQPDGEIRSDYRHVMGRKKRTLVLPSSVSFNEAEKYWENLVFHRRAGEMEDMRRVFRPEGFTTVTASVEKYRELAREGRLFSEKLAREEAGRPKTVLGEGVYVPEEDT